MTVNNNQTPLLCANGCGFFGNPETRDLCSVCYRGYLKTIALQTSNIDAKALKVEENKKPTTTAVVSLDDASSCNNKKRKANNRCHACKKRVGLLGFECRCGEVYCGSHRLPEEHSCGFDHKGLKKDILSKELLDGACKAAKLEFKI